MQIRRAVSSSRHYKRVLLLFLPVALLVFASLFFIHRTELERVHTKHAEAARERVSVGVASISRILQWVSTDLRYLALDHGFQELQDDPCQPNLRKLGREWAYFSRAKRVYDKVRWIDEKGDERLRINYAKPNPVVVPKAQLQNKRDRYFF